MQQVRDADLKGVEAFRRDLRVLEREVVRQLESQTSCCAVTLAQCHVLLELSQAELSLNGLAAALDLDASTLSRTVDGLVRMGLVDRAADPADRRSVRLTLTPDGRRKVASIDALCNRQYAGVLGQLPAKDRDAVMRSVSLLAGVMRRLRTGAPGGSSCSKTDVAAD